jgi:hypothetical protein
MDRKVRRWIQKVKVRIVRGANTINAKTEAVVVDRFSRGNVLRFSPSPLIAAHRFRFIAFHRFDCRCP